MTDTVDYDAYIAAAPERFEPALNDLWSLLARGLPDADEVVVYNMPGLNIGGAVIVGYAAFSKQRSPYLQPSAITDHA